MSTRSPAQKAAWAAILASRKAKKTNAVSGRGAYYRKAAPKKTVRRPAVRGRGAYAKDYGKRLGSVVGEGVQELLSQLGGLGGVKALTGFGDYVKAPYDVKDNSLLAMGNDPPEVINSKGKNVIVRHREYLQDVITGLAGTFSLVSYKINPGIQDTFPWLSVIAQCFEQYKLRGMIFEFKSTSADALSSTNTALGSVIMATEYDSVRPNFASKTEMENHQYAQSARQSCSMLHPVECARSQSVLDELYIRQGAVPSGVDLRMCDFGNFQIATTGQQSNNVNIGELWVSYEVELIKPDLQNIGNVLFSSAFRNYNGGASLAVQPTTSAYFGDLNVLEQHPDNSLELLFGNTTITFPDDVGNGEYLLVLNYIGGTGTNFTDRIDASVVSQTGINIGATSNFPWANFLGPTEGAIPSGSHLYIWPVQLVDKISTTALRTVTLANGVFPANVTEIRVYCTSCQHGMLGTETWEDYETPIWNVLAKKAKGRQIPQLPAAPKFSKEQLKELLRQEEEREQAEEEQVDEKVEEAQQEIDMSASTVETIQEIVARAKARRLLKEKTSGHQ